MTKMEVKADPPLVEQREAIAFVAKNPESGLLIEWTGALRDACTTV